MRILFVLVMLVPLTASAELTIRLAEFGAIDQETPERDSNGFNALVTDVVGIMGPRVVGPAATSGALGFDLNLGVSFVNIDETSTHWTKAVGEGKAPSSIGSMQLQMRKGLPYSFELEGYVNHMMDSDLWAIGVDIRYALLEGFRDMPDIAIRGGVSTVLGSRELSIFMVNTDFIISKSFGAGGLLSIAPYAGYSMALARASSYVTGRFETDAPTLDKFVFPTRSVFVHRGVLGVKMVASGVSGAIEAVVAKTSQTFTLSLGTTF